MRGTIGPDRELMVETYGRFAPDVASRVAVAVEPCRPAWIEEPVGPENAPALCIAISPSSVKWGSFHREHAIEDATDLIRSRSTPTAIFAANNILAEAPLIALKQEGLRFPRDVSIVGFGDVHWISMVDPPITTVRQPVADIGAECGRARGAPALRRERGATEHGAVPDGAHRSRLGLRGSQAQTREGLVAR
jgi:hypothetical protein